MQSQFDELTQLVEQAKVSANKLEEKKVKCESVRCRNALSSAKKLIDQLRKSVLEMKKTHDSNKENIPPPPVLVRQVAIEPVVEPIVKSMPEVKKKTPPRPRKSVVGTPHPPMAAKRESKMKKTKPATK